MCRVRFPLDPIDSNINGENKHWLYQYVWDHFAHWISPQQWLLIMYLPSLFLIFNPPKQALIVWYPSLPSLLWLFHSSAPALMLSSCLAGAWCALTLICRMLISTSAPLTAGLLEPIDATRPRWRWVCSTKVNCRQLQSVRLILEIMTLQQKLPVPGYNLHNYNCLEIYFT